MSITNEIQAEKERMQAAERLKEEYWREGMEKDSPRVIVPPEELRAVITELPLMLFTEPKFVRTMSDGRTLARRGYNKKTDTLSFDVRIDTTCKMWIFQNGTIAIVRDSDPPRNDDMYNVEYKALWLKECIIKELARREIQEEQKKEKGGCYIATAVYGSYDCPEVWVLRRYRDYFLKRTVLGRLFIRTYYAVSPTLVKWFGQKEWFRSPWRKFLDKKVATLKNAGYSDKEYED